MKTLSNISKGRQLIVIAGVVVLSALAIIAVVLIHRWYSFHKYIDTVDKYHEENEIIPEEMRDFSYYCNSKSGGSYEIGSLSYDSEGAIINVRDVESLEESNEVILTMSGFFRENPDHLINHRNLRIMMVTNNFYIEYYWDTPSNSIREIRTFSFYVPDEVSEEDFVDVQRIWIANGIALTEERIELLETIYPNAEIELV